MSSAARRVAGAIVLAVGAIARVGAAADAGGDLLAAYLADPYRNRGDMVALGRQHGGELPIPVLLAVADANVRSGRLRQAQKILNGVLAGTPPPDMAEWAEHGLGWIALVSGDFAEARAHYDRLADRMDPELGAFALALMAGMEGQVDDAVALLDQIAHASATPAALRPASGLAAGYVYYWNGADALAAARFTATATEFPASPLADDARYGAARAGLRAGNEGDAVAGLEQLAGDTPRGAGPPPALVDLEPRALFGHALRAYRHAPILGRNDQMVALLDVDGPTLARAALRTLRLDRPAAVRSSAPPRVPATRAETPAPDVANGSRTAPPVAAVPAAAPVAPDAAWHVPALLAVVLAGAALLWRRRQRADAR